MLCKSKKNGKCQAGMVNTPPPSQNCVLSWSRMALKRWIRTEIRWNKKLVGLSIIARLGRKLATQIFQERATRCINRSQRLDGDWLEYKIHVVLWWLVCQQRSWPGRPSHSGRVVLDWSTSSFLADKLTKPCSPCAPIKDPQWQSVTQKVRPSRRPTRTLTAS